MVEDHSPMAILLAAYPRRPEYDVMGTPNGRKAMPLTQEEYFQLIALGAHLQNVSIPALTILQPNRGRGFQEPWQGV
jgi:DNA-binding response OmpR family regulator